MKDKPNFFIAGASRSGTSFLYSCLRQHPEIFFHPLKEPNFFNNDRNYQEGKEKYYQLYLQEHKGFKIFADASVMYFESGFLFDAEDRHYYCLEDDSLVRIRKDISNPKILITLRNPVDRIISIHNKNVLQGRIKNKLKDEIDAELQSIKRVENSRSCWIYQCKYAFHVGRWIRMFGRENVKVIIFEEWIQDEDKALNEICRFLNIAEMADFLDISKSIRNERQYKTSLIKRFFGINREEIKVKERILDSLVADINELEIILNKDLSHWKKIK